MLAVLVGMVLSGRVAGAEEPPGTRVEERGGDADRREAVAFQFQARCVRTLGHAGFCRCVSEKVPEVVDFDAFVIMTSRTRGELGYERLSNAERALVEGALQARRACVEALGWD
jgi:hypothetical protein